MKHLITFVLMLVLVTSCSESNSSLMNDHDKYFIEAVAYRDSARVMFKSAAKHYTCHPDSVKLFLDSAMKYQQSGMTYLKKCADIRTKIENR